jgi:FKBP12-rapamycin complex-associated protein
MLGVRDSAFAMEILADLEIQYDPETFDPKSEKNRVDPPAEMDRYDKLSLETKIERLKGALSHSDQSGSPSGRFIKSADEDTGDLRDILWQRSPSAEIWIKRRTNFARTVGVGSE